MLLYFDQVFLKNLKRLCIFINFLQPSLKIPWVYLENIVGCTVLASITKRPCVKIKLFTQTVVVFA